MPKTLLLPQISAEDRGIYDQNQVCALWQRNKRSYRAGCRHRGTTVYTIRQNHHLSRYTDKTCSCSPISDGLLPTDLVPHVCSAQLANRRRPARKRHYRGGRCEQGRTISVIVTDRSRPRILHPLFTSTHDTVRPLTDKCSTTYRISYSNLIKIDTGPFIQEFSKHFKVMFHNAKSVRNKALVTI